MKIGRNDPCPCGSGKKFKRCCETKTDLEGRTVSGSAASSAGLLQEAVGHHQAGRLDKAEALYRLLLEKKPNHPDALHLLGMIGFQRGDLAAAEELIRQAISSDGKTAFFHLNLGNVLKEQGRKDDAIASFRKALSLKPDMAEAHYNLATELSVKGDFEAAVHRFKKALRCNSGLVEAHYNLGVTFGKMDRVQEAIESYGNAIKLSPHHCGSHYNIGLLYQKMEKYDEAVTHYSIALQGQPENADTHYFLGTALLELERFDKAEISFRKAIMLRTDFADAYNDLSVTLRRMGRTREALEYVQKSLTLKPGFLAYNNLGIIYREDGSLKDALETAEKAISLKPDSPEAHWNLALALLHFGNFEEGWKRYEWRALKKDSDIRTFPFDRWNGSSLEKKTLFIVSEQGIGDQIMFASLFTDIAGDPEHRIVDCDRRLVPLFARSFPGFIVVPARQQISQDGLPAIDVAISMGSLPLYLRPDLKSFPHQKSYLIADSQKTAEWRRRLNAIGEGLKVGISWRGGKDPSVRHVRSTMLEHWGSLFSIPGVHFINLQYGDCAQEIRDLQQSFGITIHDWEDADPLNDLDNFAAEIAALDLVISVDNSTVHMAGALGVPTWVLLPKACDWRWMKGVEDTPWYASMRLFRQRNHRDWSNVLMLACALLSSAAERRISIDQLTTGIANSFRDLEVPSRRFSKDRTGCQTTSVENVAAQGFSRNSDIITDEMSEQYKYRKAWDLENRVYAQFSPGLQLSEHVNFLDYFKSKGVKTVLDAGIGSGKLCKKMMSFGFNCHGLDIADNCLDEDLHYLKEEILTVGTLWDSTLFNDNSFDAVVCTDVLEHIHENHIEKVLDNFHRWTKRFVFLQVALYDDVFGAKVGAPLHLTVKPKTWWNNQVGKFAIVKDFALKGTDNTERYAVYLLEKLQPPDEVKRGEAGKHQKTGDIERKPRTLSKPQPSLIDRPIFVLGVARSGTSMVAGLLKLCGAWAGKTVQASPENPRGFFEHFVLREKVNKKILSSLNCDPLGVKVLPSLDHLPAIPDLADIVKETVFSEGYSENKPWIFKDAKLSLLWPIYRTAFPYARWVIVRRANDDIIRSCLKTSFMVQHSSDPLFWSRWIGEYLQRLEELKQSGVWWREIWPHAVVSGNLDILKHLVDDLGLNWDEREVKQFILPGSWHASEKSAGRQTTVSGLSSAEVSARIFSKPAAVMSDASCGNLAQTALLNSAPGNEEMPQDTHTTLSLPSMPGIIDKPIFIVGVPRSGTSIVAGLIHACGAWTGVTVPAGPSNPRGYFEHIILREKVNKKILSGLQCDPFGVVKLPDLHRLPDFPDLSEVVREIIRSEGYAEDGPWLFKAAKLSLLWPIYKAAFPFAQWIIVRREKEDIIKSCLRTHFMVKHSSDPTFWSDWIDEYLNRLDGLKQSGVWWREIWPHQIVSGDLGSMKQIIDDLGLAWDEHAVNQFVLPEYWHASEQNNK